MQEGERALLMPDLTDGEGAIRRNPAENSMLSAFWHSMLSASDN